MAPVELVFINAPPLATPVPFKLSGIEVTYVSPFMSIAAPEATVTPVVDPKAEVLPSFNVPALTLVAPP